MIIKVTLVIVFAVCLMQIITYLDLAINNDRHVRLSVSAHTLIAILAVILFAMNLR